MPKIKPVILNGTAGDDYLDCINHVIYPQGCVVRGGAGNDWILGAESPAGDDKLQGGPGNDIITAFAGNDTVHGGPGDDIICADCTGTQVEVPAEWGNNAVYGEAGNDWLQGGSLGNDRLYGGPGNDTIWSGEGGHNQLFGGPGVDVLVSQGTDRGFGSGPLDEMTGGKGADTFKVYVGRAIDSPRTALVLDFKPGEGDRLAFYKQDGGDVLQSYSQSQLVNPLDHPDFTVTVEAVKVGNKTKLSTVITHHPAPDDPIIALVLGLHGEFAASSDTVTKLVGYVGISKDDFILPPPAPALF
jgi:Ca2+-binding RTX toxin-like protein